MMWNVFITANIIIGSLMPIALRKYALRYPKIHYIPVLIIYICVAAVGMIVSVSHALITNIPLPSLSDYSSLWPLVGVGIFIPLSWAVNFRLIGYIGASNAAVTLLVNHLAASIFAVVLLKENISALFIIGSLLILAGVIISSFVRPDKSHTQRKSRLKIFGYITLMALSFGLGIMFEKIAIDDVSVWSYIMFGWFMQLVGALFIIGIAGKKEIAKITWPQARYALLIGVLGAVSGLAFVIALSLGQLSNTVMATSAKVALTAFLAAFILKERNQIWLRVFAVLLAIIGLWMIAK